MATTLTHRVDLATTDGKIKRIHVDQQRIKQGLPAVTVQSSAGPIKAGRVRIDGPSEMVHDYDNPLSCGAKVWIETTAPVYGEYTLP